MKQFGARWKWKDGELTLRWKKRKVKGVHYCARHGGQEVNRRGVCVVCASVDHDRGDESRPE